MSTHETIRKLASSAEKEQKLSHEELKRLLHYNPDTGQFTWLVNRGGSARKGSIAGNKIKTTGYMKIGVNCTRYLLHRLAWFYMTEEWPKYEIDHINGVKDDNRFHNLREADRSQNQFNSGMASNNSSGYKGVTYCKKSRKYKSQIMIMYKRINIGYFDTPEEAHEAYKKKALELAGQYAKWE